MAAVVTPNVLPSIVALTWTYAASLENRWPGSIGKLETEPLRTLTNFIPYLSATLKAMTAMLWASIRRWTR